MVPIQRPFPVAADAGRAAVVVGSHVQALYCYTTPAWSGCIYSGLSLLDTKFVSICNGLPQWPLPWFSSTYSTALPQTTNIAKHSASQHDQKNFSPTCY